MSPFHPLRVPVLFVVCLYLLGLCSVLSVLWLLLARASLGLAGVRWSEGSVGYKGQGLTRSLRGPPSACRPRCQSIAGLPSHCVLWPARRQGCGAMAAGARDGGCVALTAWLMLLDKEVRRSAELSGWPALSVRRPAWHWWSHGRALLFSKRLFEKDLCPKDLTASYEPKTTHERVSRGRQHT